MRRKKKQKNEEPKDTKGVKANEERKYLWKRLILGFSGPVLLTP
jgi:hypothetical protein